MKPFVSFSFAVLTAGALLSPSMNVKASDAPPHAAVEAPQGAREAEKGGLKKRAGATSLPASQGAKAEFSQPFQVSADPADLVRLSIKDGIVTVRGSVGSEELAQQLVQKFARVPGTRQVRNRLTVRTNRDSAIAVELRKLFSSDPTTDAGAIGVTVYGRRVFLSGAVSSQEERARAEELARTLPGVTRVVNGLHISTGPRYNPRVTSTARRTVRTR